MYVVWAHNRKEEEKPFPLGADYVFLGGSLFSAVVAFQCDNVHTYRTTYYLEYAANITSSLAKPLMILLL